MKRLIFFFFLLFIFVALLHVYYPDIASKYSPTWLTNFFQTWFAKPKEENVLTLYGNVDIRQVDLGFRVSGRIKAMPFEEGDFVRAGSLMALLDKQPFQDQAKQAAAHVESILASLKNAELLVKRRQQLVGTGGISEQEVDDAISSRNVFLANLKESQAALGVAKTNLSDTELFAPADGTILTRIREPGAIVKQADPIYTLSLISPIWVRAYVTERQLGLIYPNMPALVYTDTPGSHPYNGHIGFISPVAEFTPKTVETTKLRTDLVYRLRIIADNPDRGLRQGMPVTVKIRLPASPHPNPLSNRPSQRDHVNTTH